MEIQPFVLLVFGASCLGVFLLYRCVVVKRRLYKLPPGPNGFTFFGQLSPLSHVTLWDHADLYGHISGFSVLGTYVVVLNTVEIIRDALQSPRTSEVFGARNRMFFRYILYDDVIMRSPYEKHWKEQRKLLHSSLKAYGEGIAEIESVVTQELDYLKSLLYYRVGQQIDIDDYLAPSILNIVFTLLTGERYAYDDYRIQTVLEGSVAGNYLAKPFVEVLLRTIPFLKYLPFGIGKRFNLVLKSSEVFFEVAFEQCRKLPVELRKLRKGISFELIRQQDAVDWLTTDLVKGCIQDVLGAGNLTTRNSLYTFFLVLINYPEVQNTIQREIDAHVSPFSNPSLADRKNMPYTNAAILELTRYASNVAISIPHACVEDTEFYGFTVPRDAVIIPNLFRVHHDEKLWQNPWVFDPTRFLNEKDELLPANHTRRRNLIAFGVGKRKCMGETFAKARLFLYITTLLQNFSFLPGDLVVPSCDPRTFHTDIVIQPAKYRVKLQARRYGMSR